MCAIVGLRINRFNVAEHGDAQVPRCINCFDWHGSVTHVLDGKLGFLRAFCCEGAVIASVEPVAGSTASQGEMIDFFKYLPTGAFTSVSLVAQKFSSSIRMEVVLVGHVEKGDLNNLIIYYLRQRFEDRTFYQLNIISLINIRDTAHGRTFAPCSEWTAIVRNNHRLNNELRWERSHFPKTPLWVTLSWPMSPGSTNFLSQLQVQWNL